MQKAILQPERRKKADDLKKDIKENKSVLMPFSSWFQTFQGPGSLPFLDSLRGTPLPPLPMFLKLN